MPDIIDNEIHKTVTIVNHEGKARVVYIVQSISVPFECLPHSRIYTRTQLTN